VTARSPTLPSQDGRRRRTCARVALALLGVAGLGLLLGAARDSADEYEIKAGFLYNFARYTTWPEDTFADEGRDADGEVVLDPFVFAVLGTDPFEDHLEDIAETYRVSGRRIVVERWKAPAGRDERTRSEERALLGELLAPCHVLFVGRSMESRVEDVIAAVREEPVFTVSDLHGFAREGGVARFYVDSGRVRFEINIDAAERAELSIASQLLKLATIVEDED